jgi:hypothetical protein
MYWNYRLFRDPPGGMGGEITLGGDPASHYRRSLASTETIRANRRGASGSCQIPGQTLSRNKAV